MIVTIIILIIYDPLKQPIKDIHHRVAKLSVIKVANLIFAGQI